MIPTFHLHAHIHSQSTSWIWITGYNERSCRPMQQVDSTACRTSTLISTPQPRSHTTQNAQNGYHRTSQCTPPHTDSEIHFYQKVHERKETIYRAVRWFGYSMNRRGLWNRDRKFTTPQCSSFVQYGLTYTGKSISTWQNKCIDTGFHQF
jgi:hypothetical protein